MWGSTPVKADLRHTDGTEKYTFRIGRYEVAVDFAAEEKSEAVTFKTIREGDQGSAPDVRIEDRAIRIDLDGLLEMVLQRVDPLDIASELWSKNHEVREAFVDLMADGYLEITSSTFDSMDYCRIRFLKRLQQKLLMKQLNGVANALQTAEYYQKRFWDYYHGTPGAKRPECLPGVSSPWRDHDIAPEDPDYRISSKGWHESRAWWREKLIELWDLKPLLEDISLRRGDDEDHKHRCNICGAIADYSDVVAPGAGKDDASLEADRKFLGDL